MQSSSSKRYVRVSRGDPQLSRQLVEEFESGDVVPVFRSRTQVSSKDSEDVFRTGENRSGVRTVHTTRVVKHVTTSSHGENKTVTETFVTSGAEDSPAPTSATITEYHQSSPEVRSVTKTTTKVLKQSGGSSGAGQKSERTTTTTTTKKSPAVEAKVNEKSTKKIIRKTVASSDPRRKTKKISDIITGLSDESVTARDALLRWAQCTTERYPGVHVTDFTKSWKDGLAFNAIIHRNRPDLLDFRSLRSNSARDNLEYAFSLAEREFGVTRLLDPEDVDTPEPDEKSIITYISSMYDVFPDPPARHPLMDDEKHQKADEYKELAIRLQLWMHESLSLLRSRNFPNTVIEMKSLLAECSRFRSEEVPKRLKEKQQLSILHQEIQKLSQTSGRIIFEGDLKFENVEKTWDLVLSAQQEKDQAIRREITRLEKLQKLAEKVVREAKMCDVKLDDLEKKVKDEEKRIQRLHSVDAKHNCDQIESILKTVDDGIQSMRNDLKSLFESNYHQSRDLEKRIFALSERYAKIRIIFQTQLLSFLSTKSVKIEEKNSVKHKPANNEQRSLESNRTFQQLKEHSEWVEKKLKKLQNIDISCDIASVKSCLDQHRSEHKSIEQYKKKIDQCSSQKQAFTGSDYVSFCEALNHLENSYSNLLEFSTKKLYDLEVLQDFAHSAAKELKWLSDKEEIEISRDWSAKNLNLADLERYQEALTSDLEKREIQLNSIQSRAESLLSQKNLASKCIEDYLSSLQNQWSWLLQLTLCLEVHLRHAEAYHQFFKEARECEQWIKRTEEKLNTTFSRTVISVDDGEKNLKQMHQLKEELSNYSDNVMSVMKCSINIVPLKQRRQATTKPMKVKAVCNFNQPNILISKDESYSLLDSSQRTRWKVIGSSGNEVIVPSVCFVIPPPNPEAVDTSESVKKKYDSLLDLWSSKERKLRQNLIIATIRVVKSWDVSQFRTMERSQRESIIRALNDDVQKLLNEGSAEEPALQKLKQEMENCNQLVQSLVEKSTVEEKEKSPKADAKKLMDEMTMLHSELTEKEKVLKAKVNEPIIWKVVSMENLVIEHKEFEVQLRSCEVKVGEIKQSFKSMTRKTPTLQAKYDSVTLIWDRLWDLSNLYVERLKAIEMALHSFSEATQVVSNFEVQLASFDKMPSDIDALHKVHDKIMALQTEVQQQQHTFDLLSESLRNVKNLVQSSRPKQAMQSDVNKFENDIKKLIARWDNVASQIVERLRSCGAASELVRAYKNKVDEENVWVNETTVKVNSLKTVKTMTTKEVEMHVEPVMDLYTSISERNSSFEHTNILGARYIREAKIYDLRLKHYRENLEEEHPSLDACLQKNPTIICGADSIANELDFLNLQYGRLVEAVLQYLEELKACFSEHKKFKLCNITSKALPLPLKTFRTVIDQAPAQELVEVDYYSPLAAEDEFSYMQSTSLDKLPRPAVIQERNANIQGMEYSQEIVIQSRYNEVHKTTADVVVRPTSSGRTMDEIIYNSKAVFNPKTGKMLTLGEAVNDGVLDSGLEKFTDFRTGDRITLYDAVKKGYINSFIVERMSSKCGIYYPGVKEELSLIEAVQKQLYDIDRGTFLNPNDGNAITLTDAFHIGILKKAGIKTMIELGFVKASNLTISEAVRKEFLNPKTGVFRDPLSGLTMNFREAVDKRFLITSVADESDLGGTLAEAVDRNFLRSVSEMAVDGDSEKLKFADAISKGVIRSDVKEVVDTRTFEVLSIADAMQYGILNAQREKYIDKEVDAELSFHEARRRNLIFCPLTLKDACERNLIDDDGNIINPFTDEKLSIISALAKGILDSKAKCIVHPQTHDVLSVPKALQSGLLNPCGSMLDTQKAKELTLKEADAAGFVASVSHKTVFEIEGIMDVSCGEMICFNDSVARKVIDLQTCEFVNSSTNERLSLENAVSQNYMDTEIYNMLSKPVVISGNELSVIDCVRKGLLDSKTGRLIDPKTNRYLFLKEAVQNGILTPESAATLKGLLNVTVTMATLTQMVPVISDVPASEAGEKSNEKAKTNIELPKHFDGSLNLYRNNEFESYIDEQAEVPSPNKSDDVQTSLQSKNSEQGSLFSKQFSLVTCDKSSSFSEGNSVHERSIKAAMSAQSHSDEQTMYDSETSLAKPAQSFKWPVRIEENVVGSQISNEFQNRFKPFSNNSVIAPALHSITTIHQTSVESKSPIVLELPPDGWYLNEAISKKLLDAKTGFFAVPGTDQLLSFEEVVTNEIINPQSAYVLEPDTKKYVSLNKALQKRLVDAAGCCYDQNIASKLILSEAIKRKVIVLVERGSSEKKNERVPMENVLGAETERYSSSLEYQPISETYEFPDSSKIFSDADAMSIISIANKVSKDTTSSGYREISGTTTFLNNKIVCDSSQLAPDDVKDVFEDIEERNVDVPNKDGQSSFYEFSQSYALEKGFQNLSPSETFADVSGTTKAGMFSENNVFVLQKIHRSVIPLEDAVEGGFIDDKTAIVISKLIKSMLNNNTPLSLEKAVEEKQLDGERGEIVDIRRCKKVPIKEALEHGLIDSATGNLIIPIARSLSLPEAYDQGLIDSDSQMIIHPETGMLLNVHHAVLCDVINPCSLLVHPITNCCVTLEEAIKDGIVDAVRNKVKTHSGVLDLVEALQQKGLFHSVKCVLKNVPLLAPTFPVAVQHNLIDLSKQEFIHPFTKEVMTLEKAFENNAIMVVPRQVLPHSILLSDALKNKLFNFEEKTFKHPEIEAPLAISEAVDSGHLVVKQVMSTYPLLASLLRITTEETMHFHAEKSLYQLTDTESRENISPEEKFTSESSGSKFLDYKSAPCQEPLTMCDALNEGLVDLQLGQFKERSSGIFFPLSTAIKMQLLNPFEGNKQVVTAGKYTSTDVFQKYFDPENEKFIIPDRKEALTFEDLLESESIDLNTVIYDVENNLCMNLKDAMTKKLIDVKTGNYCHHKTGLKFPVKDAMKQGLLAIVGAPVLIRNLALETTEQKQKAGVLTDITPADKIVDSAGYDSPGSPESNMTKFMVCSKSQKPDLKFHDPNKLKESVKSYSIVKDIPVTEQPLDLASENQMALKSTTRSYATKHEPRETDEELDNRHEFYSAIKDEPQFTVNSTDSQSVEPSAVVIGAIPKPSQEKTAMKSYFELPKEQEKISTGIGYIGLTSSFPEAANTVNRATSDEILGASHIVKESSLTDNEEFDTNAIPIMTSSSIQQLLPVETVYIPRDESEVSPLVTDFKGNWDKSNEPNEILHSKVHGSSLVLSDMDKTGISTYCAGSEQPLDILGSKLFAIELKSQSPKEEYVNSTAQTMVCRSGSHEDEKQMISPIGVTARDLPAGSAHPVELSHVPAARISEVSFEEQQQSPEVNMSVIGEGKLRESALEFPNEMHFLPSEPGTKESSVMHPEKASDILCKERPKSLSTEFQLQPDVRTALRQSPVNMATDFVPESQSDTLQSGLTSNLKFPEESSPNSARNTKFGDIQDSMKLKERIGAEVQADLHEQKKSDLIATPEIVSRKMTGSYETEIELVLEMSSGSVMEEQSELLEEPSLTLVSEIPEELRVVVHADTLLDNRELSSNILCESDSKTWTSSHVKEMLIDTSKVEASSSTKTYDLVSDSVAGAEKVVRDNLNKPDTDFLSEKPISETRVLLSDKKLPASASTAQAESLVENSSAFPSDSSCGFSVEKPSRSVSKIQDKSQSDAILETHEKLSNESLPDESSRTLSPLQIDSSSNLETKDFEKSEGKTVSHVPLDGKLAVLAPKYFPDASTEPSYQREPITSVEQNSRSYLLFKSKTGYDASVKTPPVLTEDGNVAYNKQLLEVQLLTEREAAAGITPIQENLSVPLSPKYTSVEENIPLPQEYEHSEKKKVLMDSLGLNSWKFIHPSDDSTYADIKEYSKHPVSQPEQNVAHSLVTASEECSDIRSDFKISSHPAVVSDALQSGILVPEVSYIVIDNEQVSLAQALEKGLIDSQALIKMIKNNEVILADDKERQICQDSSMEMSVSAIEESCKVCKENTSKLLSWMEEIELRLSSLGVVKEDLSSLQLQINTTKALKDELVSQQQLVSTCLDQVRQLVLQGLEVLSKDEVQELQTNLQTVKRRYDILISECDRLLRRLVAALEELQKFKAEMNTFKSWLQYAQKEYSKRESCLGNLNKLDGHCDNYRTFASDVIAHQADLRFITMAAQKFSDESKDYLKILNMFRVNLPQHLPHIEPIQCEIKAEVQEVSAVFHSLLNHVNKLGDNYAVVQNKHRCYRDTYDKANQWLNSAKKSARKILDEPVSAEPGAVQDQLDRAKTLNMEFVGQGRLVENAQQGAKSLFESLDSFNAKSAEAEKVELTINCMRKEYDELLKAIVSKIEELQTVLIHSQDIQDGLDRILKWLDDTDAALRNQTRPVSLNSEKLEEQIQEFKILQSDVNSQRQGIDTIKISAKELMNSNPKSAKKIECKLKDLSVHFDKLCEKISKREQFLEEVLKAVRMFDTMATQFEEWTTSVIDRLENQDIVQQLDMDGFASVIEYTLNQRNTKQNEYEEMIKIGKNLAVKPNVADISHCKDKIKALEQLWKNLETLLNEKQSLGKARSEQLTAYETVRVKVSEFLTKMETIIENLEPISFDCALLKKQANEIKPLIKEHSDCGSSVEKLNGFGNTYESLIKGESPRRKTSSPVKKQGSPTKRSPSKAKSPDSFPASPTKSHVTTQSPLSTASSGFSSRRSSTDNFTGIDDLSPIQQQLSDINHHYSLLGAKLTDRSQEINQLTSQLKSYVEFTKTLKVFFDAKSKQLPKEILPSSKEQADKYIKILKVIQEEMIEKQSEVDNFVAQGKEILGRRPDAKGASDLQREQAILEQKWADLWTSVKSNLVFLQDYKDFQDAQVLLNNWLSQREKMFQVLGPVASEPRIISSQVQQVQVMKDEFMSQKSLLDRFSHNGKTILQHLNSTDPGSKKITEQMESLRYIWDDLIGRLEDRDKSLESASSVAMVFYKSQTDLHDRLQKINDSFDQLMESCGTSEDQLKKLSVLEDQLDKQRPLLTDADSICEQLCEILTDTPSKNDVRSKIGALEKSYANLSKKLSNRKAELESCLKEDRSFYKSCDDIQNWLNKTEKLFSSDTQISTNIGVLKKQVSEYEPQYKTVMNKEHELHLLLSKGTDMLGKIPVKQEQNNLKTKLENIQKQWEKLKKRALDRHTYLHRCLDNCQKYVVATEGFLPWLEASEGKVASLKVTSLQKQVLSKQVKDIQSLKNDITKHIQEFENIRQLGDILLSNCNADKDATKNELQQLRKKWENLNQDIASKMQLFEDLTQKLVEYREKVRELQHSIQRLEDKLSSHDALGSVSRDSILLDRLKALQKEAADLSKHLEGIKEFSRLLISKAGGIADSSEIQKDMETTEQKLSLLTKTLEERFSSLTTATKAISHFTGQVKSVRTELENLDDKFDKMNPVARDKTRVQQQITEIREFKSQISRVSESFKTTENLCHDMISQGYLPDTKPCEDQLSSLQKQIVRLEEHVKVREIALETVLTRIDRFYEIYNNAKKELDKIVKEEESFRTVGSDVDSIRAQQKAFKEFRAKKIQPLSRLIEDCHKQGQGIIQSSSAGVSTNELERDLENLSELWNNLQERITDQEKKLDVALLQSGKFQEALDGVQKWLKDTEEMVQNQKPPSADFKVVKAQLQEQKFLQKMLLDRQNSVVSLKMTGTEIMKSSATKKEQEQVDAQMVTIIKRFDELRETAEKRMTLLEKTIPVAHELQNTISPLMDWVEQIEKKLVVMATIPVENDNIKKKIVEQKALHEDIVTHKKQIEKLSIISGKLKQLIGEDEIQVVEQRVQTITTKYSEVTNVSSNIKKELQKAEKGVSIFVEKYERIVSWIEKTTTRLTSFQIFSVHADKLQDQMKELKKLKDAMNKEKSNIEDILSSGQDIMKNASAEDTIHMKEKLDVLNVKFSDLLNHINERLKLGEESISLVKSFYESNSKLSAWVDSAERLMKTLDSSGLNVQQTTIQKLKIEIQEYRTILETINHMGPRICQFSPGDGAASIESVMSKANHRFEALSELVQRKSERIELAVQRKFDVVGDMEELLEWFKQIEKQVSDAEAEGLSPEPSSLSILLKKQKIVNDDVNSQKGRVRDILNSAKKLMRESSAEDLSLIHEKVEKLKCISGDISSVCQDRLSAIEQALPLAEHFFETHTDLGQWLDVAEGEAQLLEAPALNAAQIKKQQDRNKGLVQSVHEHKPLVDKLNKTASALTKLCKEEQTEKVDIILESDNSRYNALRKILREHQSALEEALQATSQFSDKLEGMLSALTSTADQIQNAEPISAHPERIQEQINDNKAVLQDLEKRTSALEAVKKAADDVIVKAGSIDEPAVRDIKKKLDHLNHLWGTIQTAAYNRGKSLEEALIAAEKFWDELTAVMRALKELQDNLNSQEVPAVEPNAVQQQQEVLQEIKQEISQTKPEVDHCRQAGQDLMQLCGEPDKPEVKKHIEDLDSVWENVTTLYAKREQNLVDAMEKAMSFHDTLQNLLEFLDSAEEKFSNLGVVSNDINAVKKQVIQLKDFKSEVDPHMVEVESLNRQAQELVERTSPDQALAIREPLDDINKRWDDLLKGIVDRQQEMESVLLKLGQFQHSLEELITWISKTESVLDELKPVFGDPQVIEVVLAKHKVLTNDIQAHEASIEAINRAGRQLSETDHSIEDAKSSQNRLNGLNIKWQQLQEKSSERQRELEEALKEALEFHQEIQDLLMWLSDVDSHLVASKPVGGLPETAKEQLNRFMELYSELDGNRHKVENVLQQGQVYTKRSSDGSTKRLQHSLNTLRQRWENVQNKANDRKIKLEIALREATEFHEALQTFVEWLTNAEKYLTSLKPVSRAMKTVLEQIEDHRNFQKDVGSHREIMLNLDKKGTHLKYFSQKQDVILIKNLLISVQHRWERVVSKAAERTRSLDHGYKEAKEFHDAWTSMSNWLDEAEKTLDSITHIGNDPSKIKQLLAKHKEFQRVLGSKQISFDTTMKIGRCLKDKCSKHDVQFLQEMMDELKTRWNRVCSKSVDRQRKLEEALLYSGQFKEAVQALMDWLDKSLTKLSEVKKYHGDLDTVTMLIEQHKTFQDELKNRGLSLETVRKTADDLKERASPDDAQHISSEIEKLNLKWSKITELSINYKCKLDEALQEAESLHKSVHMLLEWLSDAEMKLRFVGQLPEDEDVTEKQIATHQEFLKEMEKQDINKNNILELAHSILKKCHPDGVSVIKHWITIIQSRWEEVSLWARQRDQRLRDHLQSLRDIMELLEKLLSWLNKAETTLTSLEAEALPDDLSALEILIKEHQVFMDDMSKKQSDVEKITKAFSSKHDTTRALPHTFKEKPRDKASRGTPLGPGKTSTPLKQHGESDIKHPRARLLLEKWRHVWLLAMERQRRLQDKYNYLKELERIKNFDFNEWRRRYLGWMNNKKSRIMDQFRKIDKNNVGKVTKQEFIDGILRSKFQTSRLEMDRVAHVFDINGDGFIDTKEYVDTLRPDRESGPKTEAEKIQDEVQRQVAKCTCVHRFKVYQVGEGKYRFGDSQKLRLVRILRSTVMVRVGGGWVALDEFLVKNDPCRAKGRTNLELREQFILAEGVSQSMTPFKPKPSPNSSVSSQSGTSFPRSGNSIPSAGPITKIREKSERSTPMHQSRSSADTSSDISGASFSETDSVSNRSAMARLTPSSARASPKTPGSKPGSRPTSRPSSRAASDLSQDGIDIYKAGRKPTASTSSQNSVSAAKSSPAGSKIPSAKRISAKSSGRPGGLTTQRKEN